MATLKVPELSVFFPCYNEEKNLKRTVDLAVKVLQKVARKWEILIIDDGSKDRSPEIARSLKKKYAPNLRIITHKPNRGYGAAFKSGLYHARYDWIAFTDSDGQFDFSEISQFIDTQKKTQADLVIGYYLKRQVSRTVILTSKIWEIIVFILFGLKVRDIDCGFKLIRKKVVDTVPQLQSERGAFISSEFLIKAKQAGFRIVEIPVHHYPRSAGQATGRKLNVILKSFSDLFKLWYQTNFSP